MPIYEYECRGCGEVHEFIQKFSDSPKRKCPSCGKLRLKKLISAAAFHLKGDGWYVTDFRDKGKSKGQGKSDSPESSSDSTSESKSSESKSADSKSAGSKSKGESKTSSGTGDSSRAA
ncbi:MAG: zinc ribbon domain-containing protein [Gammaproteobacteria bacterium]|nr:zinc ribbon domain-containing protein [Gammaproteobacteria bacterium]